MNPACATLEYASIRFTSRWAAASPAPTTTESTARPYTIGVQSQVRGCSATSNTRISAKNAATFVAALMKAVTGVGAPW